jgi:hypothetical protein
MEKRYWIGRKHAAMGMARRAATAESRLIHYDLAGRYSIKAAHCLPFLMVRKAPATEGERAVLRLPDPAADGPGPIDRKRPGGGGSPENSR